MERRRDNEWRESERGVLRDLAKARIAGEGEGGRERWRESLHHRARTCGTSVTRVLHECYTSVTRVLHEWFAHDL